ncbi:MAG: glycosyltransferase family 87 protein [Bacteroidia bacterium]
MIKIGSLTIKYTHLMLGVLITALVIFEASNPGDFKVFTEAAKLLKHHENMYDRWLNGNSCKYYYSPFFALLLTPFTSVPDFVISIVWLSANVFFFARIWKITTAFFDFNGFSKKESRAFTLLTIFLTFRFLLHNFEMAQMNVYVMWSILESLNLFEKNKNMQGALLFALAMNIKILPIVFLPYLIMRGRFAAFTWIALFSVAFLYIPSLFLGIEYNNFLLSHWFHTINPFNTEHNIDTQLGGHSLTSLIPPLLMQTDGELPLKRNIANLDLATVNIIVSTIRAALIVLTLYFTGLSFFKKAKSTIHRLWEVSYILLIIPLIFPHQEKYAFFLIFPATAYIIYFLIRTRQSNWSAFSKRTWIILVSILSVSFVLNTVTTDLFIGKYLKDVCQHYKTITYGTFLLVLILPFCKPLVLQKEREA